MGDADSADGMVVSHGVTGTSLTHGTPVGVVPTQPKVAMDRVAATLGTNPLSTVALLVRDV